MANPSSAFSCSLGNSQKTAFNRYVFASPYHKAHNRHNPRRLLLVTAQQSSFWKNFDSGFKFNKKSEEGDSKPLEKESSSVVLRSQSNPLWFSKSRQQEPGTVFVAGATGQFGARISLMLLREGFTVRAGVTDLSFSQQLAQFATQYKIIGAKDSKRLNAVKFNFKDAESTAKAIANASKAVVSIGPTEDGPSSGVTTNDALCIIEAAKLANVKHVVVVYEAEGKSLNVLDGISFFFTNIFGKSEISLADLIKKIVELDLSYTILKASSEDDFASKNDNNIVLKTEQEAGVNDKVSKTRLASVVAEVLANTSVSENKTVEVATSPSAPLRPISELLSAIPTDGIKEAYAEAQASAKAEEEAKIAADNERKAKELASQLEAEAKRLGDQEAQATQLAALVKSDAGPASIDYFIDKAKDIGIDLFGRKKETQVISSFNSQSQNNLETLVSTVTGRVATVKDKVMSPNSQSRENVKTRVARVKGGNEYAYSKQDKIAPAVPQPVKVNKILGGLFQQETIYVDDD